MGSAISICIFGKIGQKKKIQERRWNGRKERRADRNGGGKEGRRAGEGSKE